MQKVPDFLAFFNNFHLYLISNQLCTIDFSQCVLSANSHRHLLGHQVNPLFVQFRSHVRGTTFSMHFCIDNTHVEFEVKVLRKISARFWLNGHAPFYIQVNGGPKNYFQLSP